MRGPMQVLRAKDSKCSGFYIGVPASFRNSESFCLVIDLQD